MATERSSENDGKAVDLALVFLWAALCILPLLSLCQVFQVSEGREGVVVNEILSSGEIVLPKRNGEIVPSKPILFHWIGALTGWVNGETDEFRLRFPSALAAILFAAYYFTFLRQVVGRGTALTGVLLLLSTYGYVRMSQDGRVDMLFTALAVAPLLLWLRNALPYLAEERPLSEMPKTWGWSFGVCCGLAILAKGPLGLLLPLLVVGAVAFFYQRLVGLLSLLNPRVLVGLLLPLPWYLAATASGSVDFVGRQLVFENIARFFGGEGITVKPFWFYVPHIFVHLAPWSWIFLVYLYFVLQGHRRVKSGQAETNPVLPPHGSKRVLVISGIIWFLILLIFFSLSAGKRRSYLLPLAPAICTVLAVRFSATWERATHSLFGKKLERLFRYESFTWGLLAWVLTLLVGLLAYLSTSPEALALLSFSPATASAVSALAQVFERGGATLIVYYVVFSSGALLLWVVAFKRRSAILAGQALIVLVELIVVLYVGVGAAIKGFTHTYKEFAQEIGRIVPVESRINFVKTRKDESFDGFFFYFNRHVTLIDPSFRVEESGVYLARRSWMEKQPPEVRENIRELTSGGRVADEPGEKLVLFLLSSSR